MDETLIALVAAEAKACLTGISGLEERLLAAMRAAKNHWAVTDQDTQLNGAIAAVLLILKDEGKDEDYDRIRKELRTLRAVGAAASGVPVNFEALDLPENPIGLLRLWREVQEEIGGSNASWESQK